MPKIPTRKLIIAIALGTVLAACGTDPGAGPDAMGDLDHDLDGFGAADDCDDDNRFIYPDATEPCDGVDNDCDGKIDEDWDQDGDLWTTCQGDCRDNDRLSYPNAPEFADGLDNNCDGFIDNGTEAADDDGDGYAEDQGDCNDDPTNGGDLMNPAAVEVQLNSDGEPEGLDNDCDGIIDEAMEVCPSGGDPDDPASYAAAIDACQFVTGAGWDPNLGIDSRSRAIRRDFGTTYVPAVGEDFAVLSSGIAADENDPGFVRPQGGTAFTNEVAHPDPMGPVGCSSQDGSQVNDYSELALRIQVPSNAVGFSFDFNFMSVEFPEYVCSSFDDTFLAMLESESFAGNISFDAQGNRVSINVGFFDVCSVGQGTGCTGNAPLMGTGHQTDGGGTGWLTTTAPVVPGEKITLRFMIFDEGDHILDSTVLIDNFRWEIDQFECPGGTPPPCTIGREHGPAMRFSHDPLPAVFVQ